jgi:hypothetical protein
MEQRINDEIAAAREIVSNFSVVTRRPELALIRTAATDPLVDRPARVIDIVGLDKRPTAGPTCSTRPRSAVYA